MVLRVLAAVWLAALLAPEASASEVVDVRLALHPSYSRVVIELDRAAGYRLERDAAQGVFTVSVEASARPETLTLLSGAVASVEVAPGPEGARASIRLRDKKARVQESLFSDPPRIVLDFHPDVPSEARVEEAASPAPPIAKAPPEPSPQAAPEPESALEEPLPEIAPVPPVAQTAPEPTTAPAPEPASAMAPEPPTPAAPEAESAMEEPLPEADPVPPAEALPAPAYSEVDAPAESGPTMVLIVVAAVALGILVLWLRRRVRSASRSPAKTPGPWESVAASKAAERASGRRVALQSPPPGLRETGEAPAGAGSAGERVRPLEEREGKTPRSDAPKAGTTMTGMTRQR